MLKKSTATLQRATKEEPPRNFIFLTDQKLNIGYYSHGATNWLDDPQEEWHGRSLLSLMPELAPHQEVIVSTLNECGDWLSGRLTKLVDDIEQVFNLHVERLSQEQLIVTLTAVSQPTQLAQLESQNQTLKLLNRANHALIETLDSEIVLERILAVTNKIIGAEGSSVWLWDEEKTGWLLCQAAYYPDHVKSPVGHHVQMGQGVAGWVGQYSQSAVVLNAERDGRFYPGIDSESGFQTRSLLAVPLNMHDTTIGVLEIVNKLNDAFTDYDLTVAETIAATAAVAIENARLVETLQIQMEDLQAQNEELDAFDHSVAHDLQNPLSLIVGFTDVLRQAEHRDIPEEDRLHALDMIMGSTRKMSTIIHELLLLSSIRKIEVEKQPLNMEEIVDSSLMRLSYMVEEAQAHIIRPDSWPVALGHGPWIEEVWENYISNAIKYGGRPPIIELGATLEEEGQIVRFWVRDNGAGLTPDEQSRLFTPFTRLNQIKVTGQGLGLSIVQRVMNKLDGDVGVESVIDQGSTFSFSLKVANL